MSGESRTSSESVEGARARLAAVVDATDDAVIELDARGLIVGWNRGAESLMGYARDEVAGRPVALLLPIDRLCDLDEALARAVRGEAGERLDTLCLRKGGALIDVSLRASPVRDAASALVGAVLALRDRGEGRQMAHDFNNLLAVISGVADLALESMSPDDPLRVHLDDVRVACERARALTRRMMPLRPKSAHPAEARCPPSSPSPTTPRDR